MLTGHRIREEINAGGIVIDPYDPTHMNPNSYNVTLGDELLVYTLSGPLPPWLCPYEDNPTRSIKIQELGHVIKPGRLYLGVTQEYTESWSAVPMINGRSSLARLGLVVHQTGGFGDLGFCGRWTLELSCIHPLQLFAGMQIAQICWFYPQGEKMDMYKGKYQSKDDKPVASRLHLRGDLMLNWNEMIDQMKAVAGELRTGEGDLVELGSLINAWAEQIEGERLQDTLARAVQAAKAFHPVKTTDG